MLACCRRKADPIITNIEKRIAEWARIPEVHAEDTQVRQETRVPSKAAAPAAPAAPPQKLSCSLCCHLPNHKDLAELGVYQLA